MENSRRKPDWLKIKLPMGQLSVEVMNTIRGHRLHTICTSGRCPNQGECWGCGTATFMICGDVCTRACKFCNVKTGHPAPLDPQEPENIAKSIRLLKLKHAVITSVDRDDVEDLGAAHWVKVIQAIKRENPATTMEVLIPDFQGRAELVKQVIAAAPEVISHNLETVAGQNTKPPYRLSAKSQRRELCRNRVLCWGWERPGTRFWKRWTIFVLWDAG